ncbi:MAG: F0F1 ATP synthase subunit A [Anaerolineae bacterium]|nr:MAG: F0F1 ATP synthase subunit A [Anaerolineae bacterium]
MKIKKRYIIFACIILLIVFGSIIPQTRPALPTIQLPGEVYPGTQDLPVIGDIFGGITNTFISAVVAWILVMIIGISLRARSRTPDEVPSGFYNLFEWLVEGMQNYSINMSGAKKARDFLPFFITFLLYILLANMMELVPGVDSIGFYEYLPELKAVEAAELKVEVDGEFESPEAEEEYIQEQEEFFDELNLGNFKNNVMLLKAPDNAKEGDFDPSDPRAGTDPETADWTVVSFLRAAATDINFTLAMALVAMFMVQYYGFKYLGPKYLRKFFAFSIDDMAKSPINIMDPAVGLLELVGEITRIISFSFRLLGNIFAGQVLLFVIAFIIPVANIIFYGLEFFVFIIQAAVFGLLAIIFMTGATESHDDHDE